MGQYLIPDARSVQEAADYLGEPPLTRSWEKVAAGVVVRDEAATDEDLALLYQSYVPTGTADEDYQAPVPEGVRTHLQHLRDYLAADPTTITNAQTVHVVRDLIRAVHYLNRRLETE